MYKIMYIHNCRIELQRRTSPDEGMKKNEVLQFRKEDTDNVSTKEKTKMSEFDRVIGYERIKKELKLYCDAIKNPEKYRKIGANPPKGILIEGSPGTGKTLISNCFIKESGLGSITVRKKVSNGDFLKELRDVFEKAAKDTPYIVFLDDMDKFANNDAEHKDADEYAAIQALMDEYTKKGVFVIATINDSTDLPPSLLRPGRFDLTINMNNPEKEDSEKIIQHYLSQKELDHNIDYPLIAKIMCSSSCAQIEEAINYAGLLAVYSGNEKVGQKELLNACLKMQNIEVMEKRTASDYEVAVHEAGHILVYEILKPGSVVCSALVQNRWNSKVSEGITMYSYDADSLRSGKDEELDILSSLGGKAATEIVLCKTDMGCADDINHALNSIGCLHISYCATSLDVNGFTEESEWLKAYRDREVSMQLRNYYEKCKRIIHANRLFLDHLIRNLIDCRIITFRDIERIRQDLKKEGRIHDVSDFMGEESFRIDNTEVGFSA